MIDILQRNKIDIRDKRVTVIGLGVSGVAAATLANHLGAIVFASDPGANKRISTHAMDLMKSHIPTETGVQSEKIYDAELWIISPGVPKNAPIVQKAQSLGIPIVGEIEFASWYTQSPIIAVTGSNGKTTTVHILSDMCQSESIKGLIAGNIGIPFSERVLDEIKNKTVNLVYILEISSFQMEFAHHFQPKVSVYTNLSPDHLDRHGTMDEYVKMKMRMSMNQQESDYIVFNNDDDLLTSSVEDYPSQLVPFSLTKSNVNYSLSSNQIKTVSGQPLIPIDDVGLHGNHNLSNMLAAATASALVGISNERIAHVMASFSGVEHRLQNVGSFNEVTYINDSKATNLDSVIVAISSFKNPIILILGGRNKGSDFRLLLPHIKSSHVRDIISYGEAGGQINTELGDAVRSVQVTDLHSAVKRAQFLAAPGDVILFSPGCASFDQFSNFEERGQFFISIVKEMGQA